MDSNKIYKTYTNASLPGSFSGLSGFLRNNKAFKNNRNVSRVIRGIPAYTMHKPIRYTFPRAKTLVRGIDDEWQVDLVDVQNISGSNSFLKYLLVCIDVFSKYGWVIAMLNKTAPSTKKAFEKVFKDGRIPRSIYSDAGNEFKGECLKYLKDNGIEIYISTTKNKATVVERFNRTIKEKMYRYFTFNKNQLKGTNLNAKRYVEILPKLVESYNKSYHRSIKMAPIDVTIENEPIVYKNLYGQHVEKIVKFKPGNYVRIVKDKNIFEKGYTASWSPNIYIVDQVLNQVPVMYRLNEIVNNEKKEFDRIFYAEELQRVELPFDTFEVIKEVDNGFLVQKLNDDNAIPKVVPKTFVTSEYNLRRRKK
jgi:hypothetical protein